MPLKSDNYNVHARYFDRVMSALKVKVANIVRDVFMWCKIQEKNYLKL